MANSLKEFIKKQLKENMPLAEIKKDLQEKGYGIEIINKAVREVISGVDKRLPTAAIQIGVLVVGVMIAIGVGVYLTTSKTKTENIAEEVKTELSHPQCEKFTDKIKICADAINLALSKYPGDVLSVERKNVSFNTKKPPETEDIRTTAWLVSVHLASPLLTPKLNDTDPEYKSYDVDIAVDEEIKSILYVQTKGWVV